MCKLGFTGERCQTNINDCEFSMCKNNATCEDRVASYDCVCPHGFSGPYCEKKVTSCSLNPCNNGNFNYFKLNMILKVDVVKITFRD